MPIYEYYCGQCRSDLELLVRGDTTPECPACGSRALQKLLSVPAAPAASSTDLNIRESPGTCGRPECGSGGCQGF